MAALQFNSETATIIELLQRARYAHRNDPTAAPGLLLAAVNKALKAVAPGVEPWETVKRLTKEGDGWSLEAGYKALQYYEEDSKSSSAFSVYEEDDKDNYLEIAEGLVMMLADVKSNG